MTATQGYEKNDINKDAPGGNPEPPSVDPKADAEAEANVFRNSIRYEISRNWDSMTSEIVDLKAHIKDVYQDIE